jgi:hypothetical protein
MLLPAVCYWVTGLTDYVPALWLFRAFSILAFAGSCLLLLRSFQREHAHWLAGLFLVLMYVLDAKSVAFATNGMETGFMLLFLSWAIYLSTRPDRAAWLARGLCWAGLMWTRPDGCVYIAALGLANLAFPADGSRGALFRSLIRSALVCALIYFPWFAWAWWYYGSPVPHTIIAKATYGDVSYGTYVRGAVIYLWQNLLIKSPKIFGPLYFGWPKWLSQFALGLAAFCSIYWAFPVRDRLGRMVSLLFALLSIYNLFVPYIFPWYMPPIAVCGVVVLSKGLTTLAGSLPALRSVLWPLTTCLLSVITLEMGCQLFFTTWELKIDQAVIEEGNRLQVGKWLQGQVRPGDLVYLESLGYIGYFSRARVADFPGLISPAVVHLRRDLHNDFYSLLPTLRPDWVVVRPSQKDAMLYSPFTQDYHYVCSFDVQKELEEKAIQPSSALVAGILRLFDDGPKRDPYNFIPGRSFLEHDATFLVFERNRGK